MPNTTAPTVLRRLSEISAHVPAKARVLIVTTPRRRHVEALKHLLDGREVVVFDQAQVHVPQTVVDAAVEASSTYAPDVLISLGGGAATGLAKVMKLDAAFADAAYIAVATTFAGSEMTSIYGVSDGAKKVTGRDARVRPTIVVQDPALVASLPRATAVQSLVNALAHAVSALSAGIDDDDKRRRALHVIGKLSFSISQMVAHHTQAEVRAGALSAAALAGRVLDENAMGAHHKIAHVLGGRFQVPHAALHALLLPHTIAYLREHQTDLSARIHTAARTPDLAALIYDALVRTESPVALQDLGISWPDTSATLTPLGLDDAFALGAQFGLKRTARQRFVKLGDTWCVVDGDASGAQRLVVALHGRGSNAQKSASRLREALGDKDATLIVAPQPAQSAWCDAPYHADADALRAPLDAAAACVRRVADAATALWGAHPLHLFGFSQGGCVALDVATRGTIDAQSVVALAAARPTRDAAAAPRLHGLRVLLSIADDDRWVRAPDVQRDAAWLTALGAQVTLRTRPGVDHRVTDGDRIALRAHFGVSAQSPRGFGGHHHAEALEGAVPSTQNTPLHAPYGLYPEQLSGTGFVAARHQNLRTWVYRVRPSAQHSAFTKAPHPTLSADFSGAPLINLGAWDAPGLPATTTDFVDGLVTLGGAGHPSLRRGYAVHAYAANRSMNERAFTNADGDMIIMPQHGRLDVLTELGHLAAGPGDALIIPRGLRFSVSLRDADARGYIGEIYAKHFVLPERGPIGGNGLADERHFVAPTPFYEDRLTPAFRISAKMGGDVYEATQDYSPWDVAGWHGNYAPYVYDLSTFSPVSNTAFDHGDPSLYTVLSGGLDEQGAHALDLVVFPARWDPTEHTFRPPYFHRNVTTEINGIVRDPSLGEPFAPGMLFVTPSMTAHGVRAKSVENHLALDANAAKVPRKSSPSALWFQFESALPFIPSPWARAAAERRDDWPDVWGEYSSKFTPNAISTEAAS